MALPWHSPRALVIGSAALKKGQTDNACVMVVNGGNINPSLQHPLLSRSIVFLPRMDKQRTAYFPPVSPIPILNIFPSMSDRPDPRTVKRYDRHGIL